MEAKELKLTVKKNWFDLMVNGVKRWEYRKPSKWIESRLEEDTGSPKEYDTVRFTNGYGKDKPYFICEYKGYYQATEQDAGVFTYPEGNHVLVEPLDYIINLGEVVEVGNI